jgi:6-phosphogluconolactonase
MSVEDASQRGGPSWQPNLVVDGRPFERAGELLAAAISSVLANKEHARLAIPGGSALGAASAAQLRLGNDWRRIRLTWVDERCVPIADSESNRGAAARLGIVRIGGIRAGETSPSLVLPLYEDEETPVSALDRVRRGWMRDFAGGLDVALLGMGSDGHVASLFPGGSAPTEGWVAHVADSPKPPSDRITLTRAALATAGQLVLVAAGTSKREALQRLLSGDPELSAYGLEGLTIVSDIELDR